VGKRIALFIFVLLFAVIAPAVAQDTGTDENPVFTCTTPEGFVVTVTFAEPWENYTLSCNNPGWMGTVDDFVLASNESVPGDVSAWIADVQHIPAFAFEHPDASEENGFSLRELWDQEDVVFLNDKAFAYAYWRESSRFCAAGVGFMRGADLWGMYFGEHGVAEENCDTSLFLRENIQTVAYENLSCTGAFDANGRVILGLHLIDGEAINVKFDYHDVLFTIDFAPPADQ